MKRKFEPHIPDKEVIPFVEGIFDKWIIPAIEAVGKSPGYSLGFVLISCGIDYLAGFFGGEESTKDT